ncbi:MAG: ribosome-associated translation inhibitor RaiA [Chloroflexi bacterium]|nr:ribosome-associated translation inhibitor RaiA [Chloroflexota bacterium]
MDIQVRGKNVEVSDVLRSYIEKKVSKLDRFLPNIDGAQVDLAVQSTKSAQDRQVAQITLRGNGVLLRAEERSSDMRASLDQALEKLERQIKRYKGKRWRSKARTLESEVVEVAGEESEADLEIVRTKRFEARPMQVEEAIEQMELLGHDFFVFLNASSSSINVVYRRRDRGYGLLIPESA